MRKWGKYCHVKFANFVYLKSVLRTEKLLPGLFITEVCFPPGDLFARTEKTSNVIGWRQTLTSSPPNHIHLFARTEKTSNVIGWRQTLTSSPANHIHLLARKKIAR
jgi:hypothetical protein